MFDRIILNMGISECLNVQRIGEDYIRDLDQLKNLLEFVDDDSLIRDIAKIKQVRTQQSLFICCHCHFSQRLSLRQ